MKEIRDFDKTWNFTWNMSCPHNPQANRAKDAVNAANKARDT